MPTLDRDEPPILVCLTPACVMRPGAAMKGLCPRCYGKAKAMVAGGKTTWEQLVEMGLAEAPLDPFTLEFNRRSRNAADRE